MVICAPQTSPWWQLLPRLCRRPAILIPTTCGPTLSRHCSASTHARPIGDERRAVAADGRTRRHPHRPRPRPPAPPAQPRLRDAPRPARRRQHPVDGVKQILRRRTRVAQRFGAARYIIETAPSDARAPPAPCHRPRRPADGPRATNHHCDDGLCGGAMVGQRHDLEMVRQQMLVDPLRTTRPSSHTVDRELRQRSCPCLLESALFVHLIAQRMFAAQETRPRFSLMISPRRSTSIACRRR